MLSLRCLLLPQVAVRSSAGFSRAAHVQNRSGGCQVHLSKKLVSIRVLFIITTIGATGWAATLSFLAVYLAVSRDTPFWIIGVPYLATGLLSLVSQVIGGRLVDTMGRSG